MAIAVRWSPVGVNGSESRSQRAVSSPGGASAWARARLAAQRAAAQQRDLEQQQLVEREPAAAGLLVAEVRGVERRGAVRQPLEHAQSRRQRLELVADLGPVLVHERGDLHGREPFAGRIGGDVVAARDEPGLGVEVDPEAALPWYLPVSSSRVPGR